MNQEPEKRKTMRLDRSFLVDVSSPEFGKMRLVARNVSTGGIFIETSEPLPLGTKLRVHFDGDQGEIVAVGEVRNHYFLNYIDNAQPRALAGMGLRFSKFEAGGDSLRRMTH